MTLEIASVGPPPGPYAEFCTRSPEACRLEGPEVVAWSDETRLMLERINREVNTEIEFLPDIQNSGSEDRWEFPRDCFGDCEDFALEKRRRLVDAGVPSASLTMAIAFHEVMLFPHAVLLAEADTGTWVLDNMYDEVMCWDAIPYFYTRRERPDGAWSRFVQP